MFKVYEVMTSQNKINQSMIEYRIFSFFGDLHADDTITPSRHKYY